MPRKAKTEQEDAPITEKVGEAVSTVTDTVAEAVSTVAEKVGSTASAARKKVSEVVTASTGQDTTEEEAPVQENEVALPTVIATKGELTSNVTLADYLKGRRIEMGRVVSDKMQKTVVVKVERSKPHPLYKKIMRRSIKFMAHDELGAGMGDTVRIIESRPMSRHKRWQVVEIVQKAERV